MLAFLRKNVFLLRDSLKEQNYLEVRVLYTTSIVA